MKKTTETQYTDDDFGVICICAERYALGRETYMPTLVQDFIRRHISDIPTGNLKTIYDDVNDAERLGYGYGNEVIDKPGWIKFMHDISKELDRRESNAERT